MGIRETVLGWLRSSPDKSDDLADAEIDEATRQYAAAKADSKNELRFGSQPGEFDSDQDAPPR